MRNEMTSLALVLIWLLNFIDALMTIVWVSFGIALEANPLMAVVIVDPPTFLATKVTIVTLGIVLLWRYRVRSLAKVSMAVALLCYSVILIIHTDMALNLDALPYDQVKACFEMLSR